MSNRSFLRGMVAMYVFIVAIMGWMMIAGGAPFLQFLGIAALLAVVFVVLLALSAVSVHWAEKTGSGVLMPDYMPIPKGWVRQEDLRMLEELDRRRERWSEAPSAPVPELSPNVLAGAGAKAYRCPTCHTIHAINPGSIVICACGSKIRRPLSKS